LGRRQTAKITGPGVNLSFKYNDSGIRTQKDSNGVITKYRIVGTRVTFEDNGTNRLYYTYDSRGNLVSMSIIRPANLLEASSDIGIFKAPSQKSGVDIVDVTNPKTENKVKAIRLNKGAALPNIWSPLMGLKPNTNYVLEFDYWADADNIKFDMDLFPDVLPQTLAIAKTNVQTYRWEFSSASEYMTTSNLRLFNAQTSTNPANIYITNLRLFETNKTADNILGGATAIGMIAAGNLSGVSAVDISHPHTGNAIRVLRLNAGTATPVAWSPQMGLKKNTEYIVEFDYWSDSDNIRFNVDMFPDDLPEVNPIASRNVQHYKWRVNSSSSSMSGAFLRFFNGVAATNPANIYITNIKLYEASKVPETGKEYYYIRNGQGDIVALIDDAGTQVASYRYDSDTKLYYLQSRYYNPEWCRFISADVIAGQVGELLGHSVFAYVKNNPINMRDSVGYRYSFNSEEEENEYQDWLHERRFKTNRSNDTLFIMGNNLYANASNYGKEASENPHAKLAFTVTKNVGLTMVASTPGFWIGFTMDVYDNYNSNSIAQSNIEAFVTASNYKTASQLINTSARIEGTNNLLKWLWDTLTVPIQSELPSEEWLNINRKDYNWHGRGVNY
jgi:RHS repeat-associated protein